MMYKISLNKTEVEFLIDGLDHRLYDMDQEFHFYDEEPTPKYYQYIELRDTLIKLIDK